MSLFYQAMAMNPDLDRYFKEMKRAFKHGQACVKCGARLKKHLMTVDHIRDVENTDVDPFDMTNWQVLCMPCHRQKNIDKMKARSVAPQAQGAEQRKV